MRRFTSSICSVLFVVAGLASTAIAPAAGAMEWEEARRGGNVMDCRYLYCTRLGQWQPELLETGCHKYMWDWACDMMEDRDNRENPPLTQDEQDANYCALHPQSCERDDSGVLRPTN